MTKEQELMNYLHEKVFDPVLDSQKAPAKIKAGIRQTIMRMETLDATKMVQFFWTAIIGTDRSIDFSQQLKEAGFNRFEEVLEEFRIKFNDDWLRSKP